MSIKSHLNDEEFKKETEKLEEVLSDINTEITNIIQDRKYAADEIIKYRESVINDYILDEDKLIEYFDHERFVSEKFYTTMDNKLKRLVELKKSPYFGKINLTIDGEKENIYIGKFGFTKGKELIPTIVDWRAPISSIFYGNIIGDSSYKTPNGEVPVKVGFKRQFKITNSSLVGMFDSETNVVDEILQMVLSSSSEERMTEIISTIQAEQDAIIRKSKDTTVILEGVAGSGKTTIALHRIAYLLYNNREKLKDNVVIIGPNEVFLDYIKEVLPSLGEDGVLSLTFETLASEILGFDIEETFTEYFLKLEESEEEREILKLKSSKEYLLKIDSFLESFIEENLNFEDVYFYDKKIISKKEIEDMFRMDFIRMPVITRLSRIKNIVFHKIGDERNLLVYEINKKYKEFENKSTNEELNENGSQNEFQRKNMIRKILKESLRVKDNIKLIKTKDIREIYNIFNNNKMIYSSDVPLMLYMKFKLEGNKKKYIYKHLVIDEAQDLSYIKLLMLKAYINPSSATIVGDGNQSLYDFEGNMIDRVGEIFNLKNTEKIKLSKSYRSTKEIMEYANKFTKETEIIPFVRNGAAVSEIKVDNMASVGINIEKTLKKLKEDKFSSIGIIVTNVKDLEKVEEEIKHFKYQHKIKTITDIEIYNGGIALMSYHLAKGIEFDAVIVVNTESRNERVKYISCTRAMHKLYFLDVLKMN